MTQRENFLKMIHGEKPEFIPNVWELYNISRCYTLMSQPLETGYDVFGVHWLKEPEGMLPDPYAGHMLEDIADWKEVIKIPDPDSIPFKEQAAKELPGFSKDKVTVIYDSVGLFERLIAFMGFENGLCAMIEDPEACYEFFGAIADFKIACYERIIEEYHPDVLCYFDDMCTQNGPFIAPDVYRELIKPHHKRIIDSIHAKGVLFMQHMCGFVEPLLDDLVEMGIDIWNHAQPFNDLPAIMERYKGKLIVEGGWDNQSPCSQPEATEEMLEKELKRCREEYGKTGNFIVLPAILTKQGNVMAVGDLIGDSRKQFVFDKWNEMNKL